MCEDEAMMVYCYVFTGNSWTESTANWSNVNPDSYTTLLSSYDDQQNAFADGFTNALWVQKTLEGAWLGE